MRDLHSHVGVALLIASEALAADNTPPAVDLRGYDSAEIVLSVGVGGITFNGTNKIEFVLTESQDGTTYTPVAADDVLGGAVATGGIIKALKAAHAAPAAYRFGYIGKGRYLKLLADFSGTHGTPTPISAVAVLGHPSRQPVADQA